MTRAFTVTKQIGRKPKRGTVTGTYVYDKRTGEMVRIGDARSDGDIANKLDKDRVEMWTEFPRSLSPVAHKWKKWSARGFPVCDGDGDRRKYQSMVRDAGLKCEWTK